MLPPATATERSPGVGSIVCGPPPLSGTRKRPADPNQYRYVPSTAVSFTWKAGCACPVTTGTGWHCPAMQHCAPPAQTPGVTLAEPPQLWLHAPQLVPSVCRLAHLPLHIVWPFEHTSMQLPPWHVWPLGQLMP